MKLALGALAEIKNVCIALIFFKLVASTRWCLEMVCAIVSLVHSISVSDKWRCFGKVCGRSCPEMVYIMRKLMYKSKYSSLKLSPLDYSCSWVRIEKDFRYNKIDRLSIL